MINVDFSSCELPGSVPLILPVSSRRVGRIRVTESLALSLDELPYAAAHGRHTEIAITDEGGQNRRIVLVSMGPGSDDDQALRFGGSAIYDVMCARQVHSAWLSTDGWFEGDLAHEQLSQILLGVRLQSYELPVRKAIPAPKVPRRLTVACRHPAAAEKTDASAALVVSAVCAVRDMTTLPPNIMTPDCFAERALALQSAGCTTTVLNAADLDRIGCHAILAVGRGSARPPLLIAVEWRGNPEQSRVDVALIGKGITFDAGGYNLKATPYINALKVDMAGGATVLETVGLLARRRARVNAVALIACAENLVSGQAYLPSDIIDSLAGLTIEINNTDAEGRLVLCDALCYASRVYTPSAALTIATLTNTFEFLGHDTAALLTPSERLADELAVAAEHTKEAVCRMPMDVRYDFLVDSELADLSNAPPPNAFKGRTASTIAGAKFLERFVPAGMAWAHLDISGTSWNNRATPTNPKGATGYGVRLLDTWIMERYEQRA